MKLLKITFGFIISGFCLWFAFRDFQFSDLKSALSAARWAWFLPAVGLFGLAHTCRTFRWRVLLSPIEIVKPLVLLPILLFGFLINAVMPARAGEFARAFATSRWTRVTTGAALGTIAAERVTDLFGLFTLMLIALPAFPAGKLPVQLIVFILIAAAAAIAVFLILVTRFGPALRLKSKGLATKLIDLLMRVAEGFTALRSVKKVLAIIVLSWGVWACEAMSVYCVAHAMNMGLSALQSCALLVGMCVGYMIPGAPGAVGTVDFFGKRTLILLGVAPVAAISFILVLHFYQLAVVVLSGIPCMLRVGFTDKNAPLPLEPDAA